MREQFVLFVVVFSVVCLVYGGDNYVFSTIYFHPQFKEVYNSTVAVWNSGVFNEFNVLTDMKNRSNLMGLNLSISVTFLLLEESLGDLKEMRIRNDALTKHNYVLTLHLVEMLNITPNYLYYASWGHMDRKTFLYEENSTLGALQRNISEFSGSPSLIVPLRIHQFDYVVSMTPAYAAFLFRAPPLSAVSNIFYLPFDLWVWYSCVVIIVIIFFVVYVIIKWEWSNYGLHDVNKEHVATILRPKFWDVIQMEIGSICQQGSEAEPKSASGQIATFVIFMSMLFLYTAFSACIVSLLQSRANYLNSLQDLLDSKIELGILDNSYMRYFIPIQTGEMQKAIVDRKIMSPNKSGNFFPVSVGVEKMRKQFFGFFSELNTMYKEIADTYLEEEKCGIVEVPFWSLTYPHIPMRKGTQFKEIGKVGYLIMYERGIRSRNFKKFYAEKPRCVNEGGTFTSVSLNDCYFALVAYFSGVFVAVVILGMENGFQRTKKRYIIDGESITVKKFINKISE